MSTISTAYDNLVTLVQATLTNHVRMANPIKPEENDERVLALGWGIAVLPAQFPSLVSCQWENDRQIQIIISRKIEAREDDAINRADPQKDLLEDQFSLISVIENDVSLSGVATGITPTGDNGIEYAFLEKDNFVMLRTTFALKYFENLT